jgi:hypothetical protein
MMDDGQWQPGHWPKRPGTKAAERNGEARILARSEISAKSRREARETHERRFQLPKPNAKTRKAKAKSKKRKDER